MSTEELEKYKETYAQFLEEMVVLHNIHMLFLKNKARESKFLVRRSIKNIIKIQKELHKRCATTYDEHRNNSKEYFAKKREEKAYRKANPLKKGRKKKNEQLNTGTTKSV